MAARSGSDTRGNAMVMFERAFASRLYVSTSNLRQAGWWGFLISPTAVPPPGPIALDQALADTGLNGSFVYAAIPPVLDTADQTTDLIVKLDEIIQPTVSQRAVVWLPSGLVRAISATTARVQGLNTIGGQVRTNTGFDVILTGSPDVPSVNASANPGATVTVGDGGTTLVFAGSSLPAVELGGPMAPKLRQDDNSARLAFTGETLGSFRFALAIERRSLSTNLAWGFQALVPNDVTQPAQALPYVTAWLPLANGDEPVPTDYLGFAIQVNVVNPNNLLDASKTVFYFTGKNIGTSSESRTRLVSYYRTAFGKTVSLLPLGSDVTGAVPAGLVPNPGYLRTPLYNGFSFSPVGDFLLALDASEGADPAQLLCGLSGSETIAFLPNTNQQPGSRIRFFGGQAAYAPEFPIESTSPVGPPIDPTASLMTPTFQTSWANVIAAAPGQLAHYSAAPKGADPFGKPDPASSRSAAASPAGDRLLVPRDPGVALPDTDLAFPMFPMAAFTPGTGAQDLTSDQLELLDRQIVSPTRRTQITNARAQASPSAARSLGLHRAADDAPFNTTTPTGFIARVDGGPWGRLLLAQVMDGGVVTRQLGFTRPASELQAAFQTDNLFLVVANDKYLGAPASGVMPSSPPPGAAKFYQQINIDQWVFAAAAGRGSSYGDYRNIMIVKGVRGKLIDLVTSPEKWTQKDRFAAPSVVQPDGSQSAPDISQLIPLSSWLASYFQDALAKRDNPYFSGFCQILENEAWQGVLFLRVDLPGIPKELLGVLAGVTDMSSFAAHHLGVEISQIDGATVDQKDSTSLFGLVNYVDPNYDDSLPPHAITPADMTAKYELTVLTLKALFQNTKVQKFESVAQIVVNELFGSRVSKMGDGGNEFNAVLLQGAYQLNGEAPVYALSAAAPSMFFLSNNLLLSVGIETASMATRDDGATSGQVVSWVAMSGRMSFAIVTAADQPAFDIFSFGPASGQGGTQQGLAFNALGLRIAYPVGHPDHTVPTMEEQELFFSVADSQARTDSLFRNLQLELRGLISGDDTSAPGSLGYLTVATPYGLQGVAERRWHGLAFRVNLGTPGALAGKINLSSTLLIAWADDSGAPDSDGGLAASVGIQLPGTGPAGELFSLQSVLKLSVGVIRLLYNAEQRSFLLLMNEIALKFLGVLKLPPNGSTSFFLFGNPTATDPTGLGWYAVYNQDAPKS